MIIHASGAVRPLRYPSGVCGWFMLGLFLTACSGPPATAPRVGRAAHLKAPTQSVASIPLWAVGDILLGDKAQSYLDREGYDYQFRRLTGLIPPDDLLMGNLEGTITYLTEPIDSDKEYVYRMDVRATAALKDYGFDVLDLANNHALDYGIPGWRETVKALDRVGIGRFGSGENIQAALEGIVVERGGLRIGFLGFMQPFEKYQSDYDWFASPSRPGVAKMEDDLMETAIRRLHERADLVVVNLHWGGNYKPVDSYQRKWGRRAVALGADLVVGHHPHAAQGVEVYQGVPILYSVGNFTFGTPGRYKNADPLMEYSWAARCSIEGGRVAHVDLYPLSVNNRKTDFQPRRAETAVLPGLIAFVQKDIETEAPLVIFEDHARVEIPAP